MQDAAPCGKPRSPRRGRGVERAVVSSVIERTLRTLPKLNDALRAGFRAAFTDDQCMTWGRRSSAREVLREGQAWLVTMDRALKKVPPFAYSRRRLAWLAEQLLALEREVAATTDPERGEKLEARGVALKRAVEARRQLAQQLRAVIGGQRRWLEPLYASRPANAQRPQYVLTSLDATLALADQLARDKVLAPLLLDVGFDARARAAVMAVREELDRTRVATLAMAGRPGDTPSVNLLEGRVLRELRYAKRLLDDARRSGVSVPLIRVSQKLKAVFQIRKSHDDETD